MKFLGSVTFFPQNFWSILGVDLKFFAIQEFLKQQNNPSVVVDFCRRPSVLKRQLSEPLRGIDADLAYTAEQSRSEHSTA